MGNRIDKILLSLYKYASFSSLAQVAPNECDVGWGGRGMQQGVGVAGLDHGSQKKGFSQFTGNLQKRRGISHMHLHN